MTSPGPDIPLAQRSPDDQQIRVVVSGHGRTRVLVTHRAGRPTPDDEAKSGASRHRLRHLAAIAVGAATVITAVATVWLLLR